MKSLSPEEIKQRKPNVRAIKAIIVPEEGIVDYEQVMEVMAKYILNAGGKIYTNNKVLGLTTSNDNSTLLKTEKVCKLLI